MNEISHGKARQWIQKAADNLLADRELALLSVHLINCAECQKYQKGLETLQSSIRSALHQSVCLQGNPTPQDTNVNKAALLCQRLRRHVWMKTIEKFSFAFVGLLVMAGLMFGSIYLVSQTNLTATVAATSPAILAQKIPPAQSSKEPEIITITFAAEPATKSIYQPLMDDFHQEHPTITVQFVEQEPTLQMDASAQASLADVSFLSGRSNVISGIGYFRNLTPLMETDPIFQPDDFWPNALNGCQDEDGYSYGVPINLFVLGILYNPATLDTAGIGHPQPGWTWEDFRQIVASIPPGQSLSRKYSFVDLSANQDTHYLLAPVIDAYLAQQNGIIDPAAFTPTVQWYLDLVREQHIFPVTEMEKSETNQALSQDGDPAMMIGATNSWLKNDFALSKYNMAPFPIESPTEGNETTPIIATCGVISTGTNHPQEAWLWLNYISRHWIHGNEQLVYINQAVPARRSVVSKNPYWENIPTNAQEAYRFGLEHGWYGSAYPEQMGAITQAIIESTSRGTPLAHALQSKLANLPPENSLSKPSEPIVVATLRPSSTDTTRIRFFSNQVFADAEKSKRLVEGFHREHPEIEVELPSLWDPADFPGNGDDLFSFHAEKYDCFELNLPSLSMRDLSVIQDVNSWLDQDAALRADFFPGQIDAYTVDGRVYGLPASMRPNLMFYNKTLLNQLRIALPQNDWTFDDFIQMITSASTTLDGEKIFGFAPYANRDVGFLLAGRGVEWLHFGSAFPQAHFNDPSLVNAYRWIDSLRQSGVLLPTTAMDGSEAIQKVLAAGQLAFWTAESTPWGGWYFNPLEISYEVGAAPLPITPALNTANNPGMTGLFISSKSQNAQAWWTWVRYLSEQADAFSGIPARQSVAASPTWEAQIGEEKASTYRAALEQTDNALRPASWEDYVLTSMFSFSDQALKDIFAGSEAGVALSTAQRKADFVP